MLSPKYLYQNPLRLPASTNNPLIDSKEPFEPRLLLKIGQSARSIQAVDGLAQPSRWGGFFSQDLWFPIPLSISLALYLGIVCYYVIDGDLRPVNLAVLGSCVSIRLTYYRYSAAPVLSFLTVLTISFSATSTKWPWLE